MRNKVIWLLVISGFFGLGINANPLHDAIIANDCEQLRTLVSTCESRELREFDDHGLFPIHVAIKRGNISCLKILLVAGSSPYLADAWGRTPLMYALRHKNRNVRGKMVYLLFEAQWNNS